MVRFLATFFLKKHTKTLLLLYKVTIFVKTIKNKYMSKTSSKRRIEVLQSWLKSLNYLKKNK